MTNPTVTLHQLGVTEVRHYPKPNGGTRELKLKKFEVRVDGEKVGRIDSFVDRKDRTPDARTRQDGVPYVAYYDFDGKVRYHSHLRWQAVKDVLVGMELKRGLELNAAHRSAALLAQAAKEKRPVAALATSGA